jgi:hypothetical protein
VIGRRAPLIVSAEDSTSKVRKGGADTNEVLLLEHRIRMVTRDNADNDM